MATESDSSGNTYNVLRYLRRSMFDAERQNVDNQYFKKALAIDFSDVQDGSIETGTAHKLMEKFEPSQEKLKEESTKQHFNSQEDDTITACEVLICPLRCLPKSTKKDNNTQQPLAPLWIPAVLSREGKLSKSKNLTPWIERNFLLAEGSTSKQKNQILGSVNHEEEYLAQNPASEVPNEWNSYLRWGLNFLDHFSSSGNFRFSYSNEKVLDFTFGGSKFSLDEHAYIAPNPDATSSASAGILELYNRIINNKEATPLIESYCNLTSAKKRSIHTQEEIGNSLTNHLGQMNDENSLARSQRQAIHHYNSLQNGEILAVNGPPGTGKTTLLQNIVADLFVKKAIANDEPPIILASSTNNQAITNIIKSFESDHASAKPYSGRWLPNPVSSFGMYCPSRNSESDAKNKGLCYTTLGDKGFPNKIEEKDFVENAKETFLQKANDHLNTSFANISKVRTHLHKQLKDMRQIMADGEELLKKRKAFTAKMDCNHPNNTPDQIKEEVEAAAEQKETIKKGIDSISEELNQLNNVQEKWKHSYQGIVFYVRWFQALMPRFKKEIKTHNKFFFEDYSFDPAPSHMASYQGIQNYFLDTIDDLFAKKSEKEQKLETITDHHKLLQRLDKWYSKHTDANSASSEPERLNTLDQRLRHKMFWYAVHYWESRWLLETNLLVKKKASYSKEETRKKWLRYAKLTPCFVSTFYMMPKYFSHYQADTNDHLLNFADLLIVDEAGQVTPYTGGASFSLAKKALVVGDTKQIQPIDNTNKITDKENAKLDFQADHFNYQEFRQTGKSAENGSIMKVAQHQSPFQLKGLETGGMFLSEHWRCVPEVIDYCNRLVYKDKLEPQRQNAAPYHLPRMGFAHISGTSKQNNGGSRYNQEEAQAIAKWVSENADDLIKESDHTNIADIIGVITPFKRQSDEICKQLEEENSSFSDITVGTVHSLQGAEREIIIFSSVYDQNDPENYFFDQDVMMLNVAVSRAKESFLVFGDMHIFNPDNSGKPSGILANYLFEQAENELVNIKHPKAIGNTDENAVDPDVDIERISKLKRHRKLLRYCFKSANNHIIIASPFITEYAVRTDGIPKLIKQAVKQGITVSCYVDAHLNRRNGKVKKSAKRAMSLLSNAGATLKIAENFHNKTLCADNHLISEGSFNWLSAQRKLTDKYHRYERSLVYWDKNKTENKTIRELVSSFKEDMEKREL